VNRITEAIAAVRKRAGVGIDPRRRGPVPLDRVFQGVNVAHVAIPSLTLDTIARHLIVERYVSGSHVVEDLIENQQALAGLMFRLGDDGLAFVRADDVLPRRRFTAAHELGHAVLHGDRMGRYVADTAISEADDATSEMEREANLFAAELLMPEEVIRARAEELRSNYSACPRLVLAYRLASELLVSREAMRYRLKTLGVGDDD
jgi:Zn-dependent peptidase ImmA (M78 family)